MCKWEDNTKRDTTELGMDGVDWTDLAQDMNHWLILVNTVMNFHIS